MDASRRWLLPGSMRRRLASCSRGTGGCICNANSRLMTTGLGPLVRTSSVKRDRPNGSVGATLKRKIERWRDASFSVRSPSLTFSNVSVLSLMLMFCAPGIMLVTSSASVKVSPSPMKRGMAISATMGADTVTSRSALP